MDGEAGAHDVEGVCEGDGGYAGEAAAEEALVGAEGGARFAFEELGGVLAMGLRLCAVVRIRVGFAVCGRRGAHSGFTHIAASVAPKQTSRQDLAFDKLARRRQAAQIGGHLPSCKRCMR